MMTLGSLFSGTGGFELGGLLAGIEPRWLSEIEPFAVLVTHKRFPGVKHYGDVCKLKGGELEPVDIITFGFPCFPESTLVLTEDGYLPIEEIEIGMRVLTHKGRWRNVTATGAKLGETVVLKGNHYGLECTPNHPIYSSGERKYYPHLGSGKRGIRLLLTEEKTWIPAVEMKGRLWAVPKSVESLPIALAVNTGRQKAMPPISEDFFYFVGRWLGDGWVCIGPRAGRPQGQTYGHIHICDSEDKESELRETVKKMSANYSVWHDRGVVRISFASQVLAKWLTDNFGRYAHGKTMPGWVFGMQESYRASLLRGILDSDGCRVEGNAWKIGTVSKRLAESIRLLAEIQGYSTTVHNVKVAKQKVIEGRIVNQRDRYSIVITQSESRVHLSDEHHGWYRVREVRPTHETKVVYNLTVEEDNSYVADGITVHNCQSVSISGRREGLKHIEHGGETTTRSGLFYEAIRIIKEMREATDGKYPRYAVAENVPGLFTSGCGEDFRTVLEELARVKDREIHVPKPEGKWTKAGEIVGDGFSVAWRVLDAQYFGVAQRRARVYIVGDFGGESAGKILFESESLCGNIEESFGQRERDAGNTEEITGAAGGIAIENHPADSRVKISEDGKVQTLTSRMGTGGGNTPLVLAYGIGRPAFMSNFSFSLPNAAAKKVYGICSKQSHAMLSDNPHSGFYEATTTRTLDRGGVNPTCNQGGMCVCEPLTYDVRITSDGTKNARAHCYETEISRCLDTSEPNPDSNHGSVCILEKKKC